MPYGPDDSGYEGTLIKQAIKAAPPNLLRAMPARHFDAPLGPSPSKVDGDESDEGLSPAKVWLPTTDKSVRPPTAESQLFTPLGRPAPLPAEPSRYGGAETSLTRIPDTRFLLVVPKLQFASVEFYDELLSRATATRRAHEQLAHHPSPSVVCCHYFNRETKQQWAVLRSPDKSDPTQFDKLLAGIDGLLEMDECTAAAAESYRQAAWDLVYVTEKIEKTDPDKLFATEGEEESRPIQAELLRDLFSQMVLSVAMVHQAGLVHYDISDKNFLISHDRQVKVIDFGQSVIMTENGLVPAKMVSLEFASPEAMRGDRAVNRTASPDVQVNGRAQDIWALGVLLYFMITGSLKIFKHEEVVNECTPGARNVQASNRVSLLAGKDNLSDGDLDFDHPFFSSQEGNNAKELIYQLLDLDENKRGSIDLFKLQDHDFFRQALVHGKQFRSPAASLAMSDKDVLGLAHRPDIPTVSTLIPTLASSTDLHGKSKASQLAYVRARDSGLGRYVARNHANPRKRRAVHPINHLAVAAFMVLGIAAVAATAIFAPPLLAIVVPVVAVKAGVFGGVTMAVAAPVLHGIRIWRAHKRACAAYEKAAKDVEVEVLKERERSGEALVVGSTPASLFTPAEKGRGLSPPTSLPRWGSVQTQLGSMPRSQSAPGLDDTKAGTSDALASPPPRSAHRRVVTEIAVLSTPSAIHGTPERCAAPSSPGRHEGGSPMPGSFTPIGSLPGQTARGVSR